MKILDLELAYQEMLPGESLKLLIKAGLAEENPKGNILGLSGKRYRLITKITELFVRWKDVTYEITWNKVPDKKHPVLYVMEQMEKLNTTSGEPYFWMKKIKSSLFSGNNVGGEQN